jgi:putative endonuclease
MPFYIYILQSDKDGSYYKGFSMDPLRRLEEHNDGSSHYTSHKVPWRLVYVEIHATKRGALVREKVIKKYDHAQLAGIIGSHKNQLGACLA